ncbi:SANT/Myb domain-containing protein [Penicillium ucsense]|uniref:SANT/Myb domain-containing protein n=1 Tax=Penicillium ucsense TaxID=2839758 RepID=A0A8J8WEZ6_9EURO|nr:SANT/Myb domain-containing protein [Penicillium ucsense]KAF7730773.1 SANT/Myb domain-containing protein [Penicillium ucsense]
MSSASYRFESFRPWKLPQDKGQPLRDRLGVSRYPSPVSLSATPSPSNLSNPISQGQEIYAPRPERHPLPVRPPAEVCFNSGPQPNAQITRHEPDMLELPSPKDRGPESFDFEDSLYFGGPPRSGDGESAMIFEQIVPDLEHQSLDFDSNGTFPRNPTIDPAILDDHNSRDFEQAQTTETTPVAAAISGRMSVEHSRSPVRNSHRHSRRHSPGRSVKAGRLPAKISKVSVVIDNRPKSRASQFTPELGCKNVSFPTLRAQFSALSVEERLHFLSWLFEGALSHCLHPPPRREKVSTSRSQHAGESAQAGEIGCAPPSRKGLSWSEEEIRLLVKLREEENLAWSEVTEQFSQKFPGRTQGSIQVI